MFTCTKGHRSQAGDYCDECGTPIDGARTGSAGSGSVGTVSPGTGASGTGASGAPCPDCGSPQAGRFCEVCGHDFVLGAGVTSGVPDVQLLPQRTGPAPVSWTVAVTADPAYYARMQERAEPDAEPIAYPEHVPARTFRDLPPQALIGRRSRSRGVEPEIDLSGPPLDPAVSHTHAMLLTQPDGVICVVDLGSANGTYVNDEADPIEANVPRRLSTGDRVHVGAFTTLTLDGRP